MFTKKLRTKILAGYVAIVLIFAVIAAITYSDLRRINQQVSDMTDVQFEIFKINEELSYNLSERASLARAYMLYGNESYVESFEELSEEYSQAQETLLRMDDTEENRNAAERSDAWFTSVKQELFPAVARGNEEEIVAIGTKIAEETQALVEINKEHAQNRADNIEGIKKEIAGSQTRIIIILFTSTGIAIALALVIGFILANSITTPVKKLVDVSGRIAGGDLDVEIDIRSKDEIGMLAKAFAAMTDNLNDVMSNINAAAEQVAEGAKQVSGSSVDLAQGATEQASAIEELTASIEEISAQTTKNAEHANEANKLAETAKSNAVQGNSQMQAMLKAMEEINEASGNISKIIKVIDEIAFQTNILALNAAVEAARAGQYGKGFAVVADEVRNLAARSANAAKETTAMIEGSIKKTEGGTKIAKETAAALNEIVDAVARAAALVSDIAVASNEQAGGISQINQGFMQVSQVVQTNSATSEESAAASEELMEQADMLKGQITKFKIRKASRANRGHGGADEKLSPELIRMIENMIEKKKEDSESMELVPAGAKAILAGGEFGKY